MYKTHSCNQLNSSNISESVTLSGWVHRRRDHGGVIFIDLRDRYGLTQIVFDPKFNAESLKVAESLRSEYVIKITGEVRKRIDGQSNKNLDTGDIEVYVSEIEILNTSKTPPFEIDQEKNVNEELRLKYRYLDLRRERMQKNIMMRHKITSIIHEYLSKKDFLEIETPILIKGTPEGSREYMVPSRLYPGKFFVLPQSPQQLKQLLMVSGFDKYYQIARCFRDEDQRGDRQPEFTQLDMELSFVDEKEIMSLSEDLLIKLTKELLPDKKIKSTPFPIITWHEAMNKYGSDKPDIRFDMEFVDISDIVKDSGFKVFSATVENKGVVKALKVEGVSGWARSDLDKLEELAKNHGAKGLAYFIYKEEGIKSPILKFLSEDIVSKITNLTDAKTGDIVFFSADKFNIACESLGQVRLACAKKLNLIDENIFAYLWVNQFPMFEEGKESGDITAMHHPFTRPMEEDMEKLDTNPVESRAIAYDIVLNGNEIGGGSIRIHEYSLQEKIFNILGISKEDAEARFGHILEAFSYGAPPHGGIAWGLDRLVMLFAEEENIREVIAFPKDQKAKDLTLGAPSEIPEKDLNEANIKIINLK